MSFIRVCLFSLLSHADQQTFAMPDLRCLLNLVIICCAALAAGVSMTILSPFYPTEALKKVWGFKVMCNVLC